mmetsp:Transcript_14301/g.30555  ORF Transcript_14301/g.30555 Transcript_14301/m.30555 type:complete len:86 (-) Transcript_14301:735-992(-)
MQTSFTLKSTHLIMNRNSKISKIVPIYIKQSNMLTTSRSSPSKRKKSSMEDHGDALKPSASKLDATVGSVVADLESCCRPRKQGH